MHRPDLPTCWEFTTLPKVAWKTGTSYGHKDAWSIGYNPRYTVGVWVGNFTGVGRAGLNGAEKAAPLLFTIFAHLNSNTTVSWFTPPATVKESGLRRQRPNARSVLFPAAYRLFFNGLFAGRGMYDPPDLPAGYGDRLPPPAPLLLGGPGHRRARIFAVSAQVAAWLEANGQPVEKLPPLLPEWQRSCRVGHRWYVRPRRIMFIKSAAGFPWSIRKSALKRQPAMMCNALLVCRREVLWSHQTGRTSFLCTETRSLPGNLPRRPGKKRQGYDGNWRLVRMKTLVQIKNISVKETTAFG